MSSLGDERVFEAVVIVDARRAAGGSVDVSVELTSDGARRPIVSWNDEGAAGQPLVVATSRSPDRDLVAVLIGCELSRIDLRDGTRVVLERSVTWPPDEDGVIAWNESGPIVLAVDAEGARHVPLPDRRILVVDAPVSADDGFSGGDQSSMAGVSMSLGASQDDLRKAAAELVATLDEQALIEDRAWARTEGPHAPSVLFDEKASGAYGYTNLHWPVSTGPSGTIIRSSTTQSIGGGAAETTINRPWLVHPDGAVTTFDVRLGNAPLCELPDGRWLLPGADALWCDSGNEPLHALGLDGRLTPWNPNGAISTSTLLQAVAPELLPADPPENLDD